jgi:hypothetical protein
MRTTWLIVAVFTTAFVSACTVAGSDPACEGATGPISPQAVEASLRASGFTVERLDRSSFCGGIETASEQIVVHLSNEQVGSYDERHETEGGLDCFLRRIPIWGHELRKDFDAGPSSPVYTGEHAWFHLENVECTMYPGGEQPEEQVAKLDEAMEHLAGATS